MESNPLGAQVQYEFDSSQNELISDLAKKMSFVATLLIVTGILLLVSSLAGLILSFSLSAITDSIINGVFMLFIGFWTRNAAKAFQNIVKTQGHDIENLMGALGELRKLYTLQYWLVILALIFIALAFVLAIIIGITAGGI
ncbi:MAG: hypothetical protein F6K47_18965 [Symploca sp. SIO2E6]|nr:hypothetical protein [Symploca sp. SIO2E6]